MLFPFLYNSSSFVLNMWHSGGATHRAICLGLTRLLRNSDCGRDSHGKRDGSLSGPCQLRGAPLRDVTPCRRLQPACSAQCRPSLGAGGSIVSNGEFQEVTAPGHQMPSRLPCLLISVRGGDGFVAQRWLAGGPGRHKTSPGTPRTVWERDDVIVKVTSHCQCVLGTEQQEDFSPLRMCFQGLSKK